VVVPFAPGTPPDVLSRIVANALGETEGWRVVVENRPGAIGALGAAEVLRQPADGNTLMAATLPMSEAAALMPDQRHDLVRDFKGVARISRSYNVLVVHPSVPAASTPELVALLRQRPDALNFSSPGYGTPAHLIGEMFLLRTDTRATHVPYNAFPQMIADLLTGTNQFMFVTTVPVLEHIASGRLRALAVTAPARLPSLPDIATTAEQGLPDIVMEDWVGFLARSGTPEAVVARLGAAVERVLASPATQAQIRRLGVEPATMTPDAFTRFVSADVALWGGVVRDRGIRIPR
jgi:tripartite-type tricarboxylate transporter receptor subunit TctC